MPPSTAPNRNRSREPRFNPLWWWVVGAFVVLIGAWVTIILIARTHPVEEIAVPKEENAAPTAADGPTADPPPPDAG